MRSGFLLLAAAGLLLATPAVQADSTEAAAGKAAFDSITKADLIRHIKFLADDNLEGRDSGSPGARQAGDYIAALFKRVGLKPVGDKGTYFQGVPIGATSGLGKANHLKAQLEGEWVGAKVDVDYAPFPFSGNGAVKGGVVFAGYGITAPEHGYDDYAGLDVKGKIVLILRHEPQVNSESSKFDGKRHTRHAFFQTKAALAQKNGAAALIVLSNPKAAEEGDPLFGYRGQRTGGIDIPCLHIKQAVAQKWFSAAGKKLGEHQASIDKDAKPASFDMGIQVDLASELKATKKMARNVLGLLEGSDPELKDEIVVVGGHYDHVGRGFFGSLGGRNARNLIHNGADDNASGTSTVLELAQAFHAAKLRPRRSILFMTFTGEERGLIGSKFYCDNPKFPIEKHVAMINCDMVGRGETGKFQVNGVGTSPMWPELVEAINKRLGTQATFGKSGYAPSDNTSFYQKDIPVLFFFTGLHENYHRPSDDWDLINQDQIELVARYAFTVVHYLTSVLEERPAFSKTARPARQQGPRRGGPRLGVYAGEQDGTGFGVGRVMDGSAAAKAGLKEGDKIVQFGAAKITSLQDLTRALSKAKMGQTVPLKVKRGEETLDLKVTFGRGR